ncbi:hypothetical protein PFISCL1PPCAC_6320 [Pristionchus fissidentatus]|uniref:FLYWCH-type domain-containing protein n=1 Tax=Pristionchus fissidentatus TaxID=1538716 RepID=A0AAV5V9T4_9BILA|nr:hypothetical protein PFISCL1PPCAC_6320 [Pristionchus fissidentatus]
MYFLGMNSGGMPPPPFQFGMPSMEVQPDLQREAQQLFEMMGSQNGMEQLLIMQQMMATMQQDSQLQMNGSDTASSSEEPHTSSHSSGSHSPSHSISPPHQDAIDENVESIIEAIHNDVNGRSSPSQLVMSTSQHSNRETFYECFSSTNDEEVRALIYSLFVVSKGTSKDGYENFECFTRTKNKCRYKVRVKPSDGVFVVEERGCHSHPFDGSAFSSQGLPKQIREIVDLSFNEGWTNQQRQDAVDECVARHGFPPNPKMNRQMDNRLSYLRRTKNITASHSMVPPSLSFPPLSSSALTSLLEGGDPQSADLFSSIDVNSLAQLMVAQQEAMASLASFPPSDISPLNAFPPMELPAPSNLPPTDLPPN